MVLKQRNVSNVRGRSNILLRPVVTALLLLLFLAAETVLARPALAAAGNAVDTGDTAFLLVASALVMLMTPGLAFFYGGMVRQKNVLGVIMQCLAAMALISVQWVLWGYSLAFGPDHLHLLGGWTGRGSGASAWNPIPFTPPPSPTRYLPCSSSCSQ